MTTAVAVGGGWHSYRASHHDSSQHPPSPLVSFLGSFQALLCHPSPQPPPGHLGFLSAPRMRWAPSQAALPARMPFSSWPGQLPALCPWLRCFCRKPLLRVRSDPLLAIPRSWGGGSLRLLTIYVCNLCRPPCRTMNTWKAGAEVGPWTQPRTGLLRHSVREREGQVRQVCPLHQEGSTR